MLLTLTYADLAARIGRTEIAAKSLAKRRRWKRSVGNDGLARITVEEADLADVANPDRPRIGRPPANAPWKRRIDPGSNPVHELQAKLAVAEALATERQERIAVLDHDLADERLRSAEAAAVPALRDTVAALKAALESEKARIAELRAERDRLAAQRRSWWPFRRAG